MGTITITTKTYSFSKPWLLKEQEFYVMKKRFSSNPNYSLVPKSDFWNEFAIVKWSFIVFLCGLPLGAITEVLSFISGIAFIAIVFSLLGNLNSMINYSSMISKRKDLYLKFDNSIKKSNNYEEFLMNFKKVK
jgi:hypothetical protein